MSNGREELDTVRSNDDNKFKIDFIDPLFAVAIHIGFVEGLHREHWLHERLAPTHWPDLANLSLFIAAFWVIVASWVGYHQSIQKKPIIGGMRFVLDILLLALYILLLLYFKSPIALCVILVSIYTMYIAWDFYKTVEYKDKYYDDAPPSGLAYLARCFAEWLRPGRHPRLVNEAVTLGWTVFFLILLPLTWLPAFTTDLGKAIFAAILIVANYIYRYDKKTSGTWICSTQFKLLMAAIVAYLVLYHTGVPCFGSGAAA